MANIGVGFTTQMISQVILAPGLSSIFRKEIHQIIPVIDLICFFQLD
jgi:hypothetical protein